MRSIRYKTTIIAIVLILFWVTLKFPSWNKENIESVQIIDWSKVTDDPNQHLDFELIMPGDAIDSPDAHLKEDAYAKRLLEERFNVTLNYKMVDAATYDRKAALVKASGFIHDVLIEETSMLKSSIKHGFIVPIPFEVICKYAPSYARIVQEWGSYGWQGSIVDGVNYGIPLIVSDSRYPKVGIWRKDWLHAIGFDRVPDSMEEYEKVFELFKTSKPDAKSFLLAFGHELDAEQQQKASDEANPVWAMSGDVNNWRAGMFTEIFGAFNVQPFNWVFRDGEIAWGGTQEGSRKAVELLHSWYKAGFIHPDFVTDEWKGEVLSKLYAGVTGYLAHWSLYSELHPQGERVQTMGRLQRDRDRKLLLTLGKSKLEADSLIESQSQRYVNLWSPATVPRGPDGYRGHRLYGAVGGFNGGYYAFGNTVIEKPQKVLRWLRMMETIMNDENLLINISMGKENLHWELQDSELGPEPVGKEPFGTMSYKRNAEGLGWSLWHQEYGYLVQVPMKEYTVKHYFPPGKIEFRKKFTPSEWGDECLFGDTESNAPNNISSLIKRMNLYQQTKLTEFIVGALDISEWSNYVREYNMLGGDEILIGMKQYYKETLETVDRVNAVISIFQPKPL